jgi:predicted AlkP superfamily phosphohydrolase/phosphomutase
LRLRATLSAAIAAALLASDVVLLTLYLNPGASLRRDAHALAVALFLPYCAAGMVVLASVMLLADLTRGRARRRPSLLRRLPWFGPLCFCALAPAAGLYWLNLLGYRHSVPVEFVRALAGAAVGLTAAALVLVAVGVDALLFPSRGRGPSAALAVLCAATALVVPLALRPGPAAPQRPVPLATETVQPVRRIVLVGLDGLGPQELERGIAHGRLAALGALRRRGAWGPLATLRPTEGPPVWTTIMTGRLPRDHGLKSFVTYRLLGSSSPFELLPSGAGVAALERAGLVSTAPVTSTARRRPALWNALNAFGIHTGMVGIWGTYPTEKVQGFMLSHYFHALRHQPARVADTLYPPDLLPEVLARAVDPADVSPALLSEFVDLTAPQPPGEREVPWRRELVEQALAPDMTYERAGAVLRAAYDPPFFAIYFHGLDVVGHAFTRYAEPERFGNVSPEEVRRYGRVVDRYTAYLSHVVEGIGEVAEGPRPGTIVIVVSGYGMEPVSLWRRLLWAAEGGPTLSGTHRDAPDGVVLIAGDGIRAGAETRRASILDITPTILYLMGLPVARDMEGRVLTEILEDGFAAAHPVSFIPSYESLAVTPVSGAAETDLPPLPEEGS